MRLALFLLLGALLAAQPTPVIFDTDLGNDIDDTLALAMLHSLQSRGAIDLLAVTITKDEEHIAPFISALNTFYGRPNLPLGMVRNGVTKDPSPYVNATLALKNPTGGDLFPRQIRTGSDAPEATAILRHALQKAPDHAVVIIQVGFSTNLAHLIALPADLALVQRKVKLLVLMAGNFAYGEPEYNVREDIPSAQQLVAHWPTPTIWSGFEVGRDIKYPAASILRDFRYVPAHPVVEAYQRYMKMPYDRETWDLTAVLYAALPDRNYFSLSQPGRVSVDDQGHTSFTPATAEKPSPQDGRDRYLYTNPQQRTRILEALIFLSSEPPRQNPPPGRSGALIQELPR